jgi:hypothetical protein
MEEVTAAGFARVAGSAVVSREALKLHTFAIIVSIKDGHPGYVQDEYLSAVRVETTLPALELTLAGLWTREGNGYRVGDAETLRVARIVQRQLLELEENPLGNQ